MSDEPNPTPGEDKKILLKILYVFIAFLPSLVGIASFQLKNQGQGLIQFLFFLNLICSIVASLGLAQGIKSDGLQFLLNLFLIPAFFVMNVLIVLFVGCSGMGGRIAP
jgi:hypothetical protein